MTISRRAALSATAALLAAARAGVPDAEVPQGDSRGVETFFDGKRFDPANPRAYLDSLSIKKLAGA